MKKIEMQKGITLIALIITIIILLILAVVTIGSIKNSNIITYAQNASTDYKKAKNDEEDTISEYESLIGEKINEIKLTYKDGVPIPLGFYYVTGKKDTGLVISDSQADENNENGKIGNQFVWIPVPELDKFAKQYDGINYQGVLYDFSGDEPVQKNGYGIETTESREPSNITEEKMWDTDTEVNGTIIPAGTSYAYDSKEMFDLYNGGIYTETMYQETFNEMVKSVSKYGGFYVGRYETSLNNSKAQSKSGELPIRDITWYELYENSKTYSKTGVVSEMIWGCQWDAMMKFIGSQAKMTGKVDHGTEDGLSAPYRTGGYEYPGISEYKDIANNIYDLEGNIREWTQEAIGEDSRNERGGDFRAIGALPPMIRYNSNQPAKKFFHTGSRLTLYIK